MSIFTDLGEVVDNWANAYRVGKRIQNEELERELRKLQILSMKRALGLPNTSEEYQQATNEGQPYVTSKMSLAGREVLQLIPQPSLLESASAKIPWSSKLLDEAKGVLGFFGELGSSNKYGPIGSSIRRFF